MYQERFWMIGQLAGVEGGKTAAGYGMEMSVDAITPRPSTNIWMNGNVTQEVDHFKYLRSPQTNDGKSLKEVKIRLAQANSVMSRLLTVSPTSIKLYKSLVLSILLHGCENWTLTADPERQMQPFENKCYRRMLDIIIHRA